MGRGAAREEKGGGVGEKRVQRAGKDKLQPRARGLLPRVVLLLTPSPNRTNCATTSNFSNLWIQRINLRMITTP